MKLTRSMQATQALLEEEELFDVLYLARPPEYRTKRGPGGSLPGRAPNKRHDWHGRHSRLLQQYFGPDLIFDDVVFRRRYRMSRRLFSKIAIGALDHDSFSFRNKMLQARSIYQAS